MSTFTLAISCLTTSICLDSWTWHSRFLCNIAVYSIGPCFYHQSHPQLGIVFALTPSLHSFWSYFSTDPLPLRHGVLPAFAPDLGLGVAPLGRAMCTSCSHLHYGQPLLTPNSRTFSSSQTEILCPFSTNFSFPLCSFPGNHRCTSCLCDVDYSKYLLSVGSDKIWSFVTYWCHWA